MPNLTVSTIKFDYSVRCYQTTMSHKDEKVVASRDVSSPVTDARSAAATTADSATNPADSRLLHAKRSGDESAANSTQSPQDGSAAPPRGQASGASLTSLTSAASSKQSPHDDSAAPPRGDASCASLTSQTSAASNTQSPHDGSAAPPRGDASGVSLTSLTSVTSLTSSAGSSAALSCDERADESDDVFFAAGSPVVTVQRDRRKLYRCMIDCSIIHKVGFTRFVDWVWLVTYALTGVIFQVGKGKSGIFQGWKCEKCLFFLPE